MINREKYLINKREQSKRYYKKNREKIIKRTSEYQKKNRLKYNEYSKNWEKKNPEKAKARAKRYRERHIENIKEYKKENSNKYKIWRKKNKEKLNEKNKEWRKNHEKRWKEYQNEYHKKPEVIKRKREYLREKKKIDKNYRIACSLRSRFIEVLKKYGKSKKIMPSVKYGIDYKAIIEHLKPFPENLQDYEIHHIQPLFTFNFINPDGSQNLEQIKEAFKPENHIFLKKEEHYKIHKKIGNNKIKYLI